MAIASGPIVEWAGTEALRDQGVISALAPLSRLPAQVRSHVAGRMAEAEGPGLWSLVTSTNRVVRGGLGGFERALEVDSILGRALRPPAQGVLTGTLGGGSERVYPGRDGWLFYREDVEYATGRGFLDPVELRRRATPARDGTTIAQPDARVAIGRFKSDLEARGIALVVVPTPTKPGVHPEKLTRRYGDPSGVLQNPSYSTFVEDLWRDGILVFDPSQTLGAARRAGPQYLTSDTHWRPEAMEAVAEALARFIEQHAGPLRAGDPGYRIERMEVRNTGDTARMLDLPAGPSGLTSEPVWLRRVLQPDGSPWRPSRSAEVLLLGDSFSNIYSLESMAWGTSAGFAEQLSYALRRPLDRLVQNDQGAFATRAALLQDLDRLEGKRVVVYQFANRELTFGDWKVLPLPGPRTAFRTADSFKTGFAGWASGWR
jgi:alginate O-acetyltransferase complex protein AlgJ